MTARVIFQPGNGPVIEYDDGGWFAAIDLHYGVRVGWRMSRWDVFKMGARAILVAIMAKKTKPKPKPRPGYGY